MRLAGCRNWVGQRVLGNISQCLCQCRPHRSGRTRLELIEHNLSIKSKRLVGLVIESGLVVESGRQGWACEAQRFLEPTTPSY